MVKGFINGWLGVTELQESQKVDTEKFGKVFSALKEWQEAQNIDAKQFEEVFSALKEWQEAQNIDAGQFEKVFSALEKKIGTEQFQSLQEHLNGLQEKVETLTEAVAEQEKVMLVCCIVASVVALAAIGFIGFCIYQGVKSEREKNLSQGVPTGELIDLHEPDMPDTKLSANEDNSNELQANGKSM